MIHLWDEGETRMASDDLDFLDGKPSEADMREWRGALKPRCSTCGHEFHLGDDPETAALRAECERLRNELIAAATALTAAGLRFSDHRLRAQDVLSSAQRAHNAIAPPFDKGSGSATEGEG